MEFIIKANQKAGFNQNSLLVQFSIIKDTHTTKDHGTPAPRHAAAVVALHEAASTAGRNQGRQADECSRTTSPQGMNILISF